MTALEILGAVLLLGFWGFAIALPFIQPGDPPYDDRFDEEFYREAEEAHNRKVKPDEPRAADPRIRRPGL